MKIIEKFRAKSADLFGASPVTIAFLGDSVTQGCFELCATSENSFDTVFEQEYAYHTDLRKVLNLLFPRVPINIINAGISGGTAAQGVLRLERDVLKFQPDLCVVCFGLNDSVQMHETALTDYTVAIGKILDRLQENGIETILMTPNMMCTDVLPDVFPAFVKPTAKNVADIQNSGRLGKFLEAAKEEAVRRGIPVCDVYAKWQILNQNGVDTNHLLANKINHPLRSMNWLFAASLAETLFTK